MVSCALQCHVLSLVSFSAVYLLCYLWSDYWTGAGFSGSSIMYWSMDSDVPSRVFSGEQIICYLLVVVIY